MTADMDGGMVKLAQLDKAIIEERLRIFDLVAQMERAGVEHIDYAKRLLDQSQDRLDRLVLERGSLMEDD